MAYVESKRIKVFPAVNRKVEYSNDPFARHTSEETLSSIVNKLIDTDGFVITQKDNIALGNPFAFNIHGYYFKLDMLSSITNRLKLTVDGEFNKDDDFPGTKTSGSNTVTIYAGINIVTRGKIDDTNSWTELDGQDDVEDLTAETQVWQYTSVDFVIKKPSESDYSYFIPLVDFIYNWGDAASSRSFTGVTAQNSYYMKFGGSSFDVDGGDLDK